MRTAPHDTYTWTIEAIVPETHNTRTLILAPHGDRPSFIAGQYLTVQLPGFEPREGKSYSISSTPHDAHVALTIQKMGTFSSTLLEHTVGDTITTSAPYGFFYPLPDDTNDLAFVVGGIGITPCMSIIESLVRNGDTRRIHLFYSNKTVADIVFQERIEALAAKHPQVVCHYLITREACDTSRYTHGRMDPTHMEDAIRAHCDFFICGSIDFTRDMWKTLKGAGISPEQLYTEGFF